MCYIKTERLLMDDETRNMKKSSLFIPIENNQYVESVT